MPADKKVWPTTSLIDGGRNLQQFAVLEIAGNHAHPDNIEDLIIQIGRQMLLGVMVQILAVYLNGVALP